MLTFPVGFLLGAVLWICLGYFYVMAESKRKEYRYERYWHSGIPGHDTYKFKESYKFGPYARSMLMSSGVGYGKLVDTKKDVTLIRPPRDESK